MNRAKHYALYAGVGAGTYWIPDMLVQWIQPPHFVWIGLLTFAVPGLALFTWYVLSKRAPHSHFRVGLPLFMLLGIWLVGPLAVALGMVPSGGKFLEPDQFGSFLLLWTAFPIATFIMSTYSGSLGGVGLVTLGLIIAASIPGKGSRIEKI